MKITIKFCKAPIAMVLLTLCVLQPVHSRAENGAASMLENMRQSLDFSSRSIHASNGNWHLGALGLDVRTVVNGKAGDIGTLTFQPYLLRADNIPGPGGLFEDDHDWALQWRIANFNYTGLAKGRFNIRVGHFELPFGLEQVEQTNGTLYQMNSQTSLGLKADWGLSVNGVLPQAEYEIAFMLGEGNEISGTDGGMWVARLGSSSDRRWRVGVSLLRGEQQEPTLVHRTRRGLDLSYQLGAGMALAYEIARGRDAGFAVQHQLAQLLWRDRREHLFTYLQLRRSQRDDIAVKDQQESLRLGLRYEPTRRWSVSAEWQRVLTAYSNASRGSAFTAQLRIRT